MKADKPLEMFAELDNNYEPQASDLRILRLSYQHPIGQSAMVYCASKIIGD